jgi:NHLM bacteriocin system ABC transporter ATP-binding protein
MAHDALSSDASASEDRALGNHNAFVLRGARIWEVRQGHLDVFAVQLDATGAPGARSHLFRLSTGQWCLELAEGGNHPNLALLATGSSETVIGAYGRDEVQQLAHRADDHKVADRLDAWIDHVCEAMAHEMPPETCEEVGLGDVRVRARQVSWRGRHAVSWVQHTSGHSLLFGEPALCVNGQGSLPLSRRAWLATAEPVQLRIKDTNATLQEGSAWDALDRLHALFLDRLAQLRERSAGMERERLMRSTAGKRAAFVEALGRVATVVQDRPGARPHLSPAATEYPEELLLAACKLVGDAMAQPIQRPTAGANADRSDPVNAIAKSSRLRTRKVVLGDDWWRHDGGPLLAFLESGHQPVALIPRSPTHYELHDPSTMNSPVPVTSAVAATLEPFAYAFYRPLPDAALSLVDVLRFGLHGCRRDLTTALAMSVAASLLAMLVPLAVALLFDTVIPGALRSQLWQLMAILIVAAIGTAGFQITRSIALLRLNGRMGASVQAAVWDRLLSLPLTFFRPYTAGDLAMRAMGVDTARQIVFGSGMNALLNGVFSLFYFILMFYYDASLAWTAVVVIAVALVVTLSISHTQLRRQREVARLSIRTAGTMLQLVTGISKIRVAGSEAHAFALWSRLFTAQRRAQYGVRRAANAYATFATALPILSSAIIFWQVAAALETGPAMRTGQLLAFVAAFSACLAATLTSGTAATQILAAFPHYENARPIFTATPEVTGGRSQPGPLTGEIDVQHVVFRYHADAPLTLREVSIQVRAGEFVALVGPSGSGKSTLLRLLLGFETPESGAVYYDGQDLAGLDVHAVRRQIGVVLQQGRLTTGDIFTNIAGASSATVEDAWLAARLAGLEADIRQMPMGMHTVVPEGGGTLSGGQRQRLLIARALVHRPRVLLFDEATSALDNRTQAIITQSLAGLQATRIVVAHRLSTITSADRILVFDQGRIVQSGTYQDLLHQPGLFAQLARRQLA